MSSTISSSKCSLAPHSCPVKKSPSTASFYRQGHWGTRASSTAHPRSSASRLQNDKPAQGQSCALDYIFIWPPISGGSENNLWMGTDSSKASMHVDSWMDGWVADGWTEKTVFFSIINFFKFLQCWLISAIQQCKLHIHNYTYIPSLPSLPPLPTSYPSRSSQSTRLGSTCYTATPHQLSILFTSYSWCYSLNLSHFFPPPCAQVHSPHRHLHSLPANRRSGRRGFQTWGCSLPDGRSTQAPHCGLFHWSQVKSHKPISKSGTSKPFHQLPNPNQIRETEATYIPFHWDQRPCSQTAIPLCKLGRGIYLVFGEGLRYHPAHNQAACCGIWLWQSREMGQDERGGLWTGYNVGRVWDAAPWSKSSFPTTVVK